jgi:hypothetical protein
MLKVSVRTLLVPALVAVLAACASGPSGNSSVGDQLSSESQQDAARASDSATDEPMGATEASDAGIMNTGPLALPDSGWCSNVRGPVTASEADASNAFPCPGVCTDKVPISLPPPGPPGPDASRSPIGLYSCQVGNGTGINFGDN